MPIGELFGIAVSAATEAGKAGTAAFESENDAHSFAIANLSSFNFRITKDTGKAIKGQWMKAAGDLPSLLDLFDEHSGLEEKDITEIVEGLKASGGLKPWTTGVLAKAGGMWGPAALVCYDIYDKNQKTDSLLAVMVLTRPGWNYTAGVAIGNSKAIDQKYQLVNYTWHGLYDAIEKDRDTADDDPFEFMFKKFSDGAKRDLSCPVGDYKLTVEFQPAKDAFFKITDNRPLADEILKMKEDKKKKLAEAIRQGKTA